MKILIIEDEQRIARYIKKGLELKHHVADVAYDGKTGYDLAAAESYDIVILDRMLPGMTGIEICQQLRNDKNPVKILMLTAKTEVEDRVEGLDAGADDYLTKPFAFAELTARIHALSRRPHETTTDMLRVQDLTLDPQTYEVRRNDKKIHLTHKEFALLEFLMRNKGNVYTKEQLAEQVWSFDADVLPNTAQVYLGYLRKKIDRPFPDKPTLIHTVNGFGYRLE
jgi:DNA-binding response OmpR family regulator